MGKIFYDDGRGLLKIFQNITQHFEADNRFPSLQRSINQFDFDNVYTNVLDYHDHVLDFIEEYNSYILKNLSHGNEAIDRYKSEESLNFKWNRNIDAGRRLFEVCNDVWGIRVITNLTESELECEVDKFYSLAEKLNYKIDLVDFYKQSKIDGYKGIHLYFRNFAKCYPIELQFWTRKDWFLQRYTHEVIYKQDADKSAIEYSLKLRNWVDTIPVCPEGLDSFIDYYYEIINNVN